MQYTLLTPRKIVFGWGRRSEVGDLARELGRRAWIVSGSRTLARQGTIAELQERLQSAGVASELLTTVTREPEVADVDTSVARLLEAGVREGDFVIGIGGGAGLDTAKAVAALATNRHGDSVRDFLEGVGAGLTIDNDPLPLLAIPTTAGTGSEATKNAVISSYDPPFKKSLRSERMVPDTVLVDPELTVSCPPTVTAHSGMDAITQLIESYMSCRSNGFTRQMSFQGLQLLWTIEVDLEPSVLRVFETPENQVARTAMSQAALLSGIALANSGLGMAHGVAAALGVHCQVSHGLACAVLLPIAMEANRFQSDTLSYFGTFMYREGDAIRDRLDDDGFPLPDLAICEIKRLNERLGIPSRLSELGVTEDQIPDIVRSSRGNSMSGNPREIDDEELAAILRANL